MDADKLNQVIERRNEQSERDALHTAEHLIEEIVAEQQSIVRSNEHIAELRAELKALEVETVDPGQSLHRCCPANQLVAHR